MARQRNSLSDLFHPDVDRRTIYRIVATMMCAEQHTFQVLTKRPKRMAELLNDPTFRDEVHGEAVAMWPGRPGKPAPSWWTTEKPWPLRNVWWGVSIESNAYAWRADHLRAMPAAVRWVSAEPLLGPLDQLDLTGIDWLVVGGESGPSARPMHPQWVSDLRDRTRETYSECSECGGQWLVDRALIGPDGPVRVTRCADCGMDRSPETAFHFKQWGEWWPRPEDDAALRLASSFTSRWVALDGSTAHVRRGGTDAEVLRLGKGPAGREVDGRTWDEFPC